MGAVIFSLVIFFTFVIVVDNYWKGSKRRDLMNKIDDVREGLQDVNLEEQLQKAESKLEEAKDKLKEKLED